ncbi:hypothetical protein RM549_09495 [Salegentibacter sp. F188]|uniref:Uncharacterized protein n=1 Tax=Autumnicola patrickiae TaxID=3075591 RepID=A0ABU3E257_9FLAO|nr:hypothetical protein [Salegentibacter sp. F188]MDT0690017.1 hypothetical protein [Salegentibacter sp. F188]
MDVAKTAKETGEKAAKIWAAKKGLGLFGGLLKWGAIAGVAYLGYKIYKDNAE